jgi:hypothetical protein
MMRMPTRLHNGEGRVDGEAIDTCTHLIRRGKWARHAGRAVRVIGGGPFGMRVAASTSPWAAVSAGVGQGHTTVEAG